MRDRKVVDLDWKEGEQELRGVEGRETIIKMYCVRNKYTSNKRRVFKGSLLLNILTHLIYCAFNLLLAHQTNLNIEL